MLVKIKPWDEAVKAALADDKNWYVETDSIFGIGRNAGLWGQVVEGTKDSRYFCDNYSFTYPLCVVDGVVEDDDGVVDSDAILRYGKVITDDDISAYYDSKNVRIRLIEFDGNLYRHKMVNGEIVDCRRVGKAI